MAENVQPSFPGEIQQRLEIPQGSQAEGNINQNSSQGLPPPVPPVPNQPPANDHQQQAGNKNYNYLDIARFIVEILTLMVLLWYTNLTHGLWREADEANRLNVENSRLDQRAWVGVVKYDDANVIIVSPANILRLIVVNSGKTPAIRMRSRTHYGEAWKSNPFIPSYDVMKPGVRKSTQVLQPGMETILETNLISVDQGLYLSLKNGDPLLFIYGQIQYDDIFDKTHCTMFCFILKTDLKGISSCQKYNEVKDTECENMEQ